MDFERGIELSYEQYDPWEEIFMKLGKISVVFILLALCSCGARGPRIAADHAGNLPEFNRIVLETIRELPADGTHDYSWVSGYDGATQDIYLQGKKVMRGNEKSQTYCCGVTLEVFLKSYKKWLRGHGGETASVITADQWPAFQKLWFVEEVNGPGPSAAIEKFGMGKTLDPEQALPGDFIQVWRTLKEGKTTPSGHSVIFLRWEKNASGAITGIRYWSSQPGTKGIGEQVEYFGPNGGINAVSTWFGRVEPVSRKVAASKPTPQVKAKTSKKEPAKKPAPAKKK